MLGKIVSKKELAVYLGLQSPAGRVRSDRLRDLFFTDEVLEKMNLTPDQYKAKRVFTLRESYVINEELKSTHVEKKSSAPTGF